jgi:hypothetical protein
VIDVGLVRRQRAQAELLVHLEVQPDQVVGQLVGEAEVQRRRLVALGRERLEDRVLGARDLGHVGEREVVVGHRELHVAVVLAVLQRDRAQGRRPQRALVLGDPLVTLERVLRRLAEVALLDAAADPPLALAVDLDELHVLGAAEADRARLRDRAGVVVVAVLVAGARQDAARARAAEEAPALAVPELPRQHQLIARVGPRERALIGELQVDRDVRVGGLHQLVARQVQHAVGLGLLAEREGVLAQVERDERAVVEVGERLLGQHALARDLDPGADRVDLGLAGILGHVGQAAADPHALDVVDRDRRERQRAEERDLAAIDLDRRLGHLLPPLAVPVRPLEHAGEVAAAALGAADVDPQHRRVADAGEARIRQVQEAIDALRAGEHLERAVAVWLT